MVIGESIARKPANNWSYAKCLYQGQIAFISYHSYSSIVMTHSMIQACSFTMVGGDAYGSWDVNLSFSDTIW